MRRDRVRQHTIKLDLYSAKYLYRIHKLIFGKTIILKTFIPIEGALLKHFRAARIVMMINLRHLERQIKNEFLA
jgi:hypothetical protein